jgi:hypothetical protein
LAALNVGCKSRPSSSSTASSGLREFIDMVRVLTIFKARRLLIIDVLLDWSIEEGTFHVHLIELKAMISSIGK